MIRSVEAFPIRLTGRASRPADRYRAAEDVRSVYPTADELLLVRIATDDHVGWGEALAPVTPEAPAAVITHLLAPLLIGTRVEAPRATAFRLQESMRERGHLSGHHADAVAGVDIALWDLWGNICGLPVHQLLGGAYRREVPLYLTAVNGATADERAESAARAVSDGITRLKLHLTQHPRDAIAQVDAVRTAVDSVSDTAADPVRIALDAHWAHGLGDARQLGHALDQRAAWFFEAPLAPEDLPGHRRLADNLRTPIAVGEAMRHRFEYAAWASAGALGIGQPDVGRTGVSEAAAITSVLAAHHVPIAPHHSLATGIAFAAAIHVSAAAESFEAMEYSPAIGARAEGFVRTPLLDPAARRGGDVVLSDLPGLGVEVDEGAVRALARDS